MSGGPGTADVDLKLKVTATLEIHDADGNLVDTRPVEFDLTADQLAELATQQEGTPS